MHLPLEVNLDVQLWSSALDVLYYTHHYTFNKDLTQAISPKMMTVLVSGLAQC